MSTPETKSGGGEAVPCPQSPADEVKTALAGLVGDITQHLQKQEDRLTMLDRKHTLTQSRRPALATNADAEAPHQKAFAAYLRTGEDDGLRGLNIATGCGPGAMKGPMKGANIAHSKQRINDGRYIGLSEPGIIAAESPNPIVNELVILPDIEKRLEAFVRMGHGVIVFPGGAGTAEEILYLLGILLHPNNKELPFPFILTGPKSSEDYFKKIHHFIEKTLGFEAQQKYKIIIDDPALVAREMKAMVQDVSDFRRSTSDAYYYNWVLHIDQEFQLPFEPTHENMRNLKLHKELDTHLLAANLRRAFSGIVAGNVKEDGICAIEKYGKFEIKGDEEILSPLDDLLSAFVEQQRMKLPGSEYIPCYEIIK